MNNMQNRRGRGITAGTTDIEKNMMKILRPSVFEILGEVDKSREKYSSPILT